MGGGGMLRPQILNHGHRRVTIGHRHGQRDKAALADLDVGVNWSGKRVGRQDGEMQWSLGRMASVAQADGWLRKPGRMTAR